MVYYAQVVTVDEGGDDDDSECLITHPSGFTRAHTPIGAIQKLCHTFFRTF